MGIGTLLKKFWINKYRFIIYFWWSWSGHCSRCLRKYLCDGNFLKGVGSSWIRIRWIPMYVGLNSYAQAFTFSLNPQGQTRWLKACGTPTQDESPIGIAVDLNGNVAITGQTSADNQVFTFGSFTHLYKDVQFSYQDLWRSMTVSEMNDGSIRWKHIMEEVRHSRLW